MMTPDGHSGQTAPGDDRQPPPDTGAVVDLITAAAQPGVDPCDVCCEALPAHVLGDLSSPEHDWILDHTSDCRYCANELDRFERIDDTLDRLPPAWSTDPPPLPPPALRHQRAGYARIDSPVGPLWLAATEAGICEIDFAAAEPEDAFRRRLVSRGFAPYPLAAATDGGGTDRAVIERAVRQLHEYFGGRRDHFDLPLDFSGVSLFTRQVLAATAEVPFGRLDTYRAIANRVGKPSATRAVGNALGRNPIPVIVPCHRIVRSDASLGGYTGGLHIKQRLLAIEGVMLP